MSVRWGRFFLHVVFLAVSAPSFAQEEPLVLVGATLIDGTGSPAQANTWIRIQGDRISAVGEGAPPSTAADRVIDLRGRTVLPGLADMHVHLRDLEEARWMLKMLLAHGITRIKETGNRLGNLAAIRRWAEGEDGLPRIYMSGATINGSFADLQFLREGREVQARLEDNAALGVEFLKAYNWDSSQALKQMGLFAQAEGITLTGHVPLGMTSVAAIDAGMKILEHVRLRPSEVLDDPEIIARYPIDLSVTRRTGFWAHLVPDGRAVSRTLDAWTKRREDFFLDPTIVVQWAIANSDGPAADALAPFLDRVSSPMLTRWRTGSGRSGEQGEDALTSQEYAEAKGSAEGWVTFTGLAHERGIRVLTGTDTPVEWVIPGYSLHQELEFFVRAGMSPAEAIRCSTGRASEAFGTPDQGTIASGHVADLVVVRGDVSEDITNLREVEKVILAGRIYERSELFEEAKRLMPAE